MRHFIFVLSMVGLISLLQGCTTKDLIDTRGVQGCYVAGVNADSSIIDLNGSRTALWCSETLPENYKFSFDDGRTKVSIGDAN